MQQYLYLCLEAVSCACCILIILSSSTYQGAFKDTMVSIDKQSHIYLEGGSLSRSPDLDARLWETKDTVEESVTTIIAVAVRV